jgi:hypothetical protein
MDVDSDVPFVGELRLTGVDPHANADRAAADRLAGGGCGRDRVGRSREGDEESIALGVDLDAVVPGERSSQRGAVFGEQIGVPGAVFPEEPRGAFDVCEEKGDGSGRQVGPRHARDDLMGPYAMLQFGPSTKDVKVCAICRVWETGIHRAPGSMAWPPDPATTRRHVLEGR